MNLYDRQSLPISRGAGASGAGGALLTLMFFLPWFSACGINISGKDLAFGVTMNMGLLGSTSAPPTYPWLALVLLAGLVAVAIALLDFVPSLQLGSLRLYLMLGAGGLASLLMAIVLLGYVRETASNVNVVKVEYGLPGALLGAVLMLGGALFEWSAHRRLVGAAAYAPSPSPAAAAWQPQPIAPPLGPSRAWLSCQSGALAGQTIELLGDRLTIGRSAENQLRIPDSLVSRSHAVVRYAQGRYYLQDQQSSHGTLLNGQPIQASILNDGDLITVGDTTFQFRVQ